MSNRYWVGILDAAIQVDGAILEAPIPIVEFCSLKQAPSKAPQGRGLPIPSNRISWKPHKMHAVLALCKHIGVTDSLKSDQLETLSPEFQTLQHLDEWLPIPSNRISWKQQLPRTHTSIPRFWGVTDSLKSDQLETALLDNSWNGDCLTVTDSLKSDQLETN